MIERTDRGAAGGRLAGIVALVAEAQMPGGRATALRLAAEGAAIVAHDRKPSAAVEEVATACGGISATADVSNPGSVEEMVAGVEEAVGPIEVLVFNAVPPTSPEPFLEQAADDWWQRMDADLSGAFYLVRSVLPGMRRTGRGRIVLVASEWGVVGHPYASAYATSCAGLISFGKTLGRELAPDNIITNVVAPGAVETLAPRIDGEEVPAVSAIVPPIGRMGAPEDVAAVVALVAIEGASGFVGQVLQPNGGTTRSRA